MHRATKPVKPGRRRRKKVSRYTKSVIRWLIFCFPAGLLMMWSDRCRWSRLTKSLVSLGLCLLVLAVVVPQTLPPERAKGGVELVSAVPVAEIQGPIQKESDEGAYELYIAPYVQPASLVVQPTPTPVPVYVYCNDGGKNYHTKDCRYVKKTSARVTLEQAVAAGFTGCAKCDAPEYG